MYKNSKIKNKIKGKQRNENVLEFESPRKTGVYYQIESLMHKCLRKCDWGS
jgi:hypothetical protein